MNEIEKFGRFEQVKSRATKPDESRKKSLYFLLLAVGRQRALRLPELRQAYREALQSLVIEKMDKSWQIEIGSIKFKREINRDEFQFYKTGLATIQDKVAESNRRIADDFWKAFEYEIIPLSYTAVSRSARLRRVITNNINLNFSQFLQVSLIILLLIPKGSRLFLYLGLAFIPIIRIFWFSKYKWQSLFLYFAIILSFGINFRSSPQSTPSVSPIVIFSALNTFIWSTIYYIKSRSSKNDYKTKILIIMSVFIAILSQTLGVNPFYTVGFASTIILSIYLNSKRKNSITNKKVVLITMGLEIASGIALGIFLLAQSQIGFNFQNTIFLIFTIFVFTLWVIHFSIYERYPMVFRAFFPFLTAPTILLEQTNDILMPLALMTIIIVNLCIPKRIRGNKVDNE